MGHPERMGLAYGWSEATFIERIAHDARPTGTPYENLCIGCDRFHEQVLGPVLEAARERRRRARRREAVRRRARPSPCSRTTDDDRAACALALAARRVARRACAGRAWDDVAREGARPDRQLQRVGRRREDQRVHRVGRRAKSKRATASRSNHVKLKDTAEAVTRVVAEKAAGRDTRRQRRPDLDQRAQFPRAEGAGLLYGPFAQALPNYRYVDTVNVRSNVVDFTIPVDGLRVAVAARADRVRLRRQARQRCAALGAASCSRGRSGIPGRTTHPTVRNFLGSTFLKQALYELAPDPVGAAAAGDRRQLRDRDRAAVGVVRRAAAVAVAQGRAVSRERPGAAPADERRRDRHDDLVQSRRSRGVAQSAGQLPDIGAHGRVRQGHDRQHELRRDSVQRGEQGRRDGRRRTSCSSRRRRRTRRTIRQMGNFTVLDLAQARRRPSASASTIFRVSRRCRRNAELGTTLLEPHPSWMTRIAAEWERRYTK